MRDILFRGKRIDNGEWVYGQYAFLLNARTEDGEPIKHMIVDGTPFGQTVDPSTVGQYTGLTDKKCGRRLIGKPAVSKTATLGSNHNAHAMVSASTQTLTTWIASAVPSKADERRSHPL